MPGKPWVPRFLSDLLDGITLSTDGTFASNSDAKVPTEKAVKSRIDALGAFLPVHDLAGASSDYALAVGETAKLAYSAATSVLLHVDCTGGQRYELSIDGDRSVSVGTNANVYLSPNNTTYGTSISLNEQVFTTSLVASAQTARAYFKVADCLLLTATAKICTALKAKSVVSRSLCATPGPVNNLYINSSTWVDTTTAWTSLGTIAFPFAQSGTIIIRRIL